MGLGAVRLADLEEYVRVVMALLRGETVEAEIENKKRLIRLLNPELGLINTRDQIPLYVAASGSAGAKLDREARAGLIATAGDVDGGIAAMTDMRERRRAAGREAEPLDAVVLTGGAILEEGEPADLPRAIAQAGPRAAMLLHRAADASLAGLPMMAPMPPAAPSVAGLRRAGPQIHTARRPLSRKPPRPFDVRQARGAAVCHRRIDPADDLHGNREGAERTHRGIGRRRLHGDRIADRARPGTRDRGLGPHPPLLRVKGSTSHRPRRCRLRSRHRATADSRCGPSPTARCCGMPSCVMPQPSRPCCTATTAASAYTPMITGERQQIPDWPSGSIAAGPAAVPRSDYHQMRSIGSGTAR